MKSALHTLGVMAVVSLLMVGATSSTYGHDGKLNLHVTPFSAHSRLKVPASTPSCLTELNQHPP